MKQFTGDAQQHKNRQMPAALQRIFSPSRKSATPLAQGPLKKSADSQFSRSPLLEEKYANENKSAFKAAWEDTNYSDILKKSFENIKSNPLQLSIMLGTYIAAVSVIKFGLPRIELQPFFSEALSWVRVSSNSMLIGAGTTFFGDLYAQNALPSDVKNRMTVSKRIARAGIMAAAMGAAVSGIGTDNTLRLGKFLSEAIGASKFVHQNILFGLVQIPLMSTYFFLYYKLIDAFNKKIAKIEIPENEQKDQKREFYVNVCKAWLIGIPANLLACYLIPYFPIELSYPITMVLSFTYFLFRTVATGK